MTTTYCGETERLGPDRKAVCGQKTPDGLHQCKHCAQREADDEQMRKAALSVARVAHEVCGALAVSRGDYSSKPWESLDSVNRQQLQSRVIGFLNNPGLHPTAHLGNAVATLSADDRAAAYVFHGVVHAIAREQSRD